MDRFQVGDRVLFTFLPRWVKGPLTDEEYSLPVGGPVNRGTLSEFLVADQSELVRAPRNLSPAEAATLPVAGVTAWHSLTRAHIERDDWVLIHGTGGVALFAMQLAIAQGARVIVTSSSAEKRKRLLEVGASAVLDHTTEDVAQRTRDITGGRGADVIVETVGGGNLNVSLDAVRVSGRIAFVGLLAGLEAEVSTYKLVTRNITLHGIETGSRELLEELVEFMETRDIHPIIDSEFPRSDVAEALRYLQSAKHFGKVVLTA